MFIEDTEAEKLEEFGVDLPPIKDRVSMEPSISYSVYEPRVTDTVDAQLIEDMREEYIALRAKKFRSDHKKMNIYASGSKPHRKKRRNRIGRIILGGTGLC